VALFATEACRAAVKEMPSSQAGPSLTGGRHTTCVWALLQVCWLVLL
jgi:hypothetical protein